MQLVQKRLKKEAIKMLKKAATVPLLNNIKFVSLSSLITL